MSILRFDMRAPSFAKTSRRDLYSAALDMAAWADARGFESIVVSEHHGTDDGYLPSPLVLAGALVGRTQRIRIRVGAALLPLYDPVRLAEDLAVLDLASGGRVCVTAGLGYRAEEYAMFGVDWERRGALMDEGLDVLLRALSGEAFVYRGRPVRISPLPLSDPRELVMVGGMSKAAARRAARVGLAFQPGVNTPEVLQVYREECERQGVESPLLLPPGSGEMIWVSEDPERTWREIGPHLLHDAMAYARWQPARQRSAVHSDAGSVEELRAEGKYRVLSPDECLEWAEAQGALTVFTHFPLCGGAPPEVGWRSLELYAEKVLPRLVSPR